MPHGDAASCRFPPSCRTIFTARRFFKMSAHSAATAILRAIWFWITRSSSVERSMDCFGTHARRARSNTTRLAMLSFRSPLPTTSLVRCDKTPQKIGEAIGNSFCQDVVIVVTKAFADLDESFSLEFFCLISL
jgi:hypothetical protein